jgi:hypothetical protein
LGGLPALVPGIASAQTDVRVQLTPPGTTVPGIQQASPVPAGAAALPGLQTGSSSSEQSVLVQLNPLWFVSNSALDIDETDFTAFAASVGIRIEYSLLIVAEYADLSAENANGPEAVGLTAYGIRLEWHLGEDAMGPSWYLAAGAYRWAWNASGSRWADYWLADLDEVDGVLPGFCLGRQFPIEPLMLRIGAGITPTTPLLDLQIGFAF